MFFLRQKEEQEEEKGNKEHKEEHIERQAGQLAAANDALKMNNDMNHRGTTVWMKEERDHR